MTHSASTNRFIPIRFKLGAAAALLAVVPLAIAGWLVFLTNQRAIARSSVALQLGVAEDVSRSLVDQVEPIADSLQAIADALSDPRLEPALKIAVAQSLVTGSRSLSAIAIVSDEGAVIDRIVEEGASAADLHAPSKRAKLAARNRGFTLDVVSADGQVRVFGVARLAPSATAGTAAQGPSGFVVGEVPLDRLNARIGRLVDETFIDEIEEIFVVDVTGPIIAQRAREGTAVKTADDLVFLEGVHKAAKGKDVINAGPFVDRDGTLRYGGVVSTSNTDWAVVVQTSQSKALAPVVQTRNIVLATLLAAAFLALLCGVLLSRRLSRPLERLAAMARALANRDFGARVDVKSTDEVGLLATTMNATAGALKESEDKLVEETEVRKDIARYLPAELVDAVVKREHDLRLGGRRRHVAVLFADIVAFTPMAEKLEAEQTVALLNELFTYLTEIIFRHQGTVDKFIGDSVMALFGIVDDDASPEDIAMSAVECAEEMLQWLEVGNATWKEKYGATIRLAIGINLGDAVVGNIGTERRMEFTAIGRTVNVAARLESVARPQQVLVTEPVVDACGGTFTFRPLGDQALTGSSAQVAVFALE